MWSHNEVPDTCQVWNNGGYHQQLKKNDWKWLTTRPTTFDEIGQEKENRAHLNQIY